MPTPILLPKQGNTVESCLIVGWKKKAGEAVTKGEVLCEVETDKAVFEVVSPADGILLGTFFKEGDDVPVLTTIAVIGNAGEQFDGPAPGEAAAQGASGAGRTDPAPAVDVRPEPGGDRTAPGGGISPRARAHLEKVRIPADDIQGTGPGGRIIERDVMDAAKRVEPLTLAARVQADGRSTRPGSGSGIGSRITAADLNAGESDRRPSPAGSDVEVVPLKGVRKIIAERMLASLRNSAQLTLHASADAASLLDLRAKFKQSSVFEEFRQVTINDLVHHAVVRALQTHPALNSLLIDDRIEYHKRIHLGFAVDTPRGLVVPVIRNAQEFSLLGLCAEAKRLAGACQSGKINPADLAGGTFTVTNLGGLGIESFTPVLNLPQTCILGVNAIGLKAVDDGQGVRHVPHVSFSLTIDHRAIDGAVGARFLQTLSVVIAELGSDVTIDGARK